MPPSTSPLPAARRWPANAGNYRVIITNSAGSITSAVATLIVLVPPSITTEPTNITVASGGEARFSATALGTSPLAYKWQFGGTNLAGATDAALLLTNV